MDCVLSSREAVYVEHTLGGKWRPLVPQDRREWFVALS